VARHALIELVIELREELIEARREIAELHRRMAHIMRPARVTQVDAEKGLFKVAYALDDEGNPVESPWIRYAHRNSKKNQVWDPPGVDEQVILFSPGGDVSPLSWIMPGGFYDDIPKNHDKEDEYKRTVSSSLFLMKDGEIRFKADKLILEGEVHLGGEGGQLVHRKGDVDSDGDTAETSASKVYAV
jgi:hypothetical protein